MFVVLINLYTNTIYETKIKNYCVSCSGDSSL